MDIQTSAGLKPEEDLGTLPHDGALPLERRRLQCYLALIAADVAAIFGGFLCSGYFYLGSEGTRQAAELAQLVLRVFLTIALYNGAYSLGALTDPPSGAARALLALGIGAAVVVFIAFYTKSSAEFSRFLFSLGISLSALAIGWAREQMRTFVAWRCGGQFIDELVISDGGPQIDLPGARRIDAKAAGLVPALDDPQALHRIGMLIHAADRVVISCTAERRLAWATILKGANIEGEVVDDTVALLGAHGARIADGHGLLRVSVGPR